MVQNNLKNGKHSPILFDSTNIRGEFLSVYGYSIRVDADTNIYILLIVGVYVYIYNRPGGWYLSHVTAVYGTEGFQEVR